MRRAVRYVISVEIPALVLETRLYQCVARDVYQDVAIQPIDIG